MSYTASFTDTLAHAREKVSSSVAALAQAARAKTAPAVIDNEPASQPLEPAPAPIEPSVVSMNAKMKGTIETSDEVRILGSLEGDIRAAAVTICAGGFVKGELKADTVIVHGGAEGRILARDVRLYAGAKVKGEIRHHTLGIDTAAIFEGSVARDTAIAAAE